MKFEEQNDEVKNLRAEWKSEKKEEISIIYILFYKTRTKKKRVDSHNKFIRDLSLKDLVKSKRTEGRF